MKYLSTYWETKILAGTLLYRNGMQPDLQHLRVRPVLGFTQGATAHSRLGDDEAAPEGWDNVAASLGPVAEQGPTPVFLSPHLPCQLAS